MVVMRIKNLSALSLILAFGLTACNDSTGPNDDFDPAAEASMGEWMTQHGAALQG